VVGACACSSLCFSVIAIICAARDVIARVELARIGTLEPV